MLTLDYRYRCQIQYDPKELIQSYVEFKKKGSFWKFNLFDLSLAFKIIDMKCTLLFLVSFFFLSVFGIEPTKLASKHVHLEEINANWKKNSNHGSTDLIQFSTDEDRIQLHLMEVVRLLKSNNPFLENRKVSQNRLHLIEVLATYAQQKVFPKNSFHSIRTPYFIDQFGNYCAVGFLVKESGFDGISKSIAANQNFAYVHDIDSPELLNWSIKHGFTLDELALIQPGYSPTTPHNQIGDGTNGEVKSSARDNMNNWYFSGSFTELDSLPCLNVGKYANNQLSCLGGGLPGIVNSIDWYESDVVLATGIFEHEGETFAVARFDGDSWSYIALPDSVQGEGMFVDGYKYGFDKSYFVVIKEDSATYTVWNNQNDSWNFIAKSNGIIKTVFAERINKYFIGGDFDSLLVLENQSLNWFATKNVYIRDYFDHIKVQGVVPDVVQTIVKNGAYYYFGGTKNDEPNSSFTFLSSYLNGFAQPLIFKSNSNEDFSVGIYSLVVESQQSLLVGGEFFQDIGNLFGRNIGRYMIHTNLLIPLSWLNNRVNTISVVNDRIVAGGNFSLNSFNNPIHFLAELNHTLSLENQTSHSFNKFIISPNPVENFLTISFDATESVAELKIIDATGKIIHQISGFSSQIDCSSIVPGSYYLEAILDSGERILRNFIK